ncbi:hypothetical protein ACGFOW_03730 [Streptomyces rubiginosohelvolus]|uniref:hypothetical protein n=1 Tax=Streptomyces rubiginosohelvolus TaxID=67362 RepID=UPI0037188F55
MIQIALKLVKQVIMAGQPDFSDRSIGEQRGGGNSLPHLIRDQSQYSEYGDFRFVVAEMQRAHDQQMHELEKRILELEREARFGAKEHGEIREDLRKVTGQISSHLAAHSRARTDVASTEHIEQEALASEISRLVQQRLHSLARKCVKRTDVVSGYPQREHAPRLLGAICAILLPPGKPDLHQLRALLNIREEGSLYEEAVSVHDDAIRLRQATESSSMSCVWETDFLPGSAVDFERQEVWPGCHGRRTAQFLIAPGYSVNGQPFLLQQVFAGP